jgi:hypothetical protein
MARAVGERDRITGGYPPKRSHSIPPLNYSATTLCGYPFIP